MSTHTRTRVHTNRANARILLCNCKHFVLVAWTQTRHHLQSSRIS